MTDTPGTELNPAGIQSLGWDDLQVLLAICQTQTLSGAARTLRLNHSTVARRINAIEDRTGVRFFERLSNGYIMTQAGEVAFEYGKRVDAEIQALELKVLGQDMALSGPVRVTCPEGIALSVISPMLISFAKQNPEVTLELIATSAALDMKRRETEVAIRATKRPPETAYGRKICEFRLALYSSHQYLERVGDMPVAEHDWCMLSDTSQWLVPQIWGRPEDGEAQTVFSCRSPYPLIDAVASGMGTTMMPCYLGDPDERLIRISAPLKPLYMSLWALTHDELRRTARVRALMTHLTGELGALSDLFVGKTIGDRFDIRLDQSA